MATIKLDDKGVKKAFKDLLKLKAKMHKAWVDNSENKDYNKLHEEFRAMLYDFLKQDFFCLTKIQIFQLISLCSTYRPLALHSILIRFSMLYDEKTKIPQK